jgi:hypothetical protein
VYIFRDTTKSEGNGGAKGRVERAGRAETQSRGDGIRVGERRSQSMHCSRSRGLRETFFRLCRVVVDLGMKAEGDGSDVACFCFSVVTACSHSGTEITTL